MTKTDKEERERNPGRRGARARKREKGGSGRRTRLPEWTNGSPCTGNEVSKQHGEAREQDNPFPLTKTDWRLCASDCLTEDEEAK
ncbi:hypothetical protein E2C01_094219 [Portunus trituberculatus]|uniref:Uncharacterized protein n=1 Tax=Portunus trituberculatus TaxID=210409 RepID=A0A5B7K2I4_PORTR|nr:hypothetical protein [Portunus trituberculatus]